MSLAKALPLISIIEFIIFVRLGVNPSALLECLHLEALGVRVSLVTLGGYCHLDVLSSEDRRAEVGDCLRL